MHLLCPLMLCFRSVRFLDHAVSFPTRLVRLQSFLPVVNKLLHSILHCLIEVIHLRELLLRELSHIHMVSIEFVEKKLLIVQIVARWLNYTGYISSIWLKNYCHIHQNRFTFVFSEMYLSCDFNSASDSCKRMILSSKGTDCKVEELMLFWIWVNNLSTSRRSFEIWYIELLEGCIKDGDSSTQRLVVFGLSEGSLSMILWVVGNCKSECNSSFSCLIELWHSERDWSITTM